MPKDLLRYDLMIEEALRTVVKETMNRVARDGLPGEHHFYVTFQTKHAGVVLPDYLMEQYPEEMTIVLQHQFFGLQADETGFSVMLSFNNVRERLTIPFEAITTFVDPSVNFALQFQTAPTEGKSEGEGSEPGSESPSEAGAEGEPEKRGEVISLDKFRKK